MEIGTLDGDSYLAFCQAIVNQHLGTKSFAINTLEDRQETDSPEDNRYRQFLTRHNSRYTNFSQPLRISTKEALERFGDGTIDLLHVDGYHSYESLSSDFELWLPKLSDSGIILFHDIAVRTSEVDLWRFWEEVNKRFPAISFAHSNGLGILLTGEHQTEIVQSLVADYESCPSAVTEIFAALGERITLLAQLERNSRYIHDLEEILTNSRSELQHLASTLTERNIEVQMISKSFHKQEQILKKQRTDERRLQHELNLSLARADEVLSSDTWRATAPLRHSLTLIRRLLGWQRYLKRVEPNLVPLHGVAPTPMTKGGNQIALGGRVRYQLGISHLYPGWYEFSFQLTTAPESPVTTVRPYIITKTCQGRRYSQVAESTINSNGIVRIPFHVNAESASWDLLIINMGGPYKITRARVTALSAPSSNPAIRQILRLAGRHSLPSTIDMTSPTQAHLPKEDAYSRWLEILWQERNDMTTTNEKTLPPLSQPLISIIMPVYNNKIAHIIQAIESVRAQSYTHWELCIADDGSTKPDIVPLLESYAHHDARIKFTIRDRNGGISACSNTALQLASGQWVGYLDADDELATNCLECYAGEIVKRPSLDLLFCDEDKILETGERLEPYFKPSLSPALLLGKNMVTHFAVYKKSLIDELGGLRTEFDGSQDWDLVLRLVKRDPMVTLRTKRIPQVLYHWRRHSLSVASGLEAKPWANVSGAAAVGDFLVGIADGAKVTAISSNATVKVELPSTPPLPSTSILIATSGKYEIISECLVRLERFGLPDNCEIRVIVDSPYEPDPAGISFLQQWRANDPKLRSLTLSNRHGASFNYSRSINTIASEAQGDILVLLNDDVLVQHSHWLEQILATFRLPRVQIVGVHLLYPNGKVQHAGVTLGLGGVASSAYRGSDPSTPGYYADLQLYRNVSAVTGACLAVYRDVFQEVGRLDEFNLPVAYNDIDLCLRVLRDGGLIVQNPYVRMIHAESVSRGNDLELRYRERFTHEQNIFKERWGDYIKDDPYFNPNLDLLHPYPTPKYLSVSDDGTEYYANPTEDPPG